MDVCRKSIALPPPLPVLPVRLCPRLPARESDDALLERVSELERSWLPAALELDRGLPAALLLLPLLSAPRELDLPSRELDLLRTPTGRSTDLERGARSVSAPEDGSDAPSTEPAAVLAARPLRT